MVKNHIYKPVPDANDKFHKNKIHKIPYITFFLFNNTNYQNSQEFYLQSFQFKLNINTDIIAETYKGTRLTIIQQNRVPSVLHYASW